MALLLHFEQLWCRTLSMTLRKFISETCPPQRNSFHLTLSNAVSNSYIFSMLPTAHPSPFTYLCLSQKMEQFKNISCKLPSNVSSISTVYRIQTIFFLSLSLYIYFFQLGPGDCLGSSIGRAPLHRAGDPGSNPGPDPMRYQSLMPNDHSI